MNKYTTNPKKKPSFKIRKTLHGSVRKLKRRREANR